MEVTCAKCGKPYVVSDEAVRGRAFKYRCRVCNIYNTVPASAAPLPLRHASRPDGDGPMSGRDPRETWTPLPVHLVPSESAPPPDPGRDEVAASPGESTQPNVDVAPPPGAERPDAEATEPETTGDVSSESAGLFPVAGFSSASAGEPPAPPSAPAPPVAAVAPPAVAARLELRSAERSGAFESEDSLTRLDDIRAIGEASLAARRDPNAVDLDELLRLGEGGFRAPMTGALVAMPAIRAPSSRLALTAIALVVVVAASNVALFFYLDQRSAAAEPRALAAAPADVVRPAAAVARDLGNSAVGALTMDVKPAIARGDAPTAAQPQPPAPAPVVAASPAAQPAPAPGPEARRDAETRRSRSERVERAQDAAAAPRPEPVAAPAAEVAPVTEAAPAAEEAPAAPAPAASPAASASETPVARAVTEALSSGEPVEPSPAADGAAAEFPATLTSQQVLAVMNGLAPRIRRCGDGTPGTVHVDVTISGSGRVTSALVTGQFAGTPIGSCAARTVRAARFPQFGQPSMTVRFPYPI